MQRAQFIDAVSTFIRLQDTAAGVSEIPTDRNLFDLGLLESFKLPQLVAFLTDELRLDVDLTQVGMESFYTIDVMYSSFAAPTRGAEPS